MSDLFEISKLDAKQEASEETEQQFVEHVRIAVLMLNETLNPVMPAPPIQ